MDYLHQSKSYKGYHYSVLSSEMLNYLHLRLKEMLSQLVPIFDKNDIKYSICGGTLLGALTQKKHFPWDEDIDICVLEEDYDKTKDIIIEAINEGRIKDVFLNSDITEPFYYHDWIKLVDTRSRVYPNDELYQHNGVWIDIYKLIPVERAHVRDMVMAGVAKYNINRFNKGGLSKEQLDLRLASLKNTNIPIGGLDTPGESEVYIVWSASKNIINKSDVFPLKEYEFDGLSLKGFYNPEAFLQNHYGDDFRTLPPDEMRRVGINKVYIL